MTPRRSPCGAASSNDLDVVDERHRLVDVEPERDRPEGVAHPAVKNSMPGESCPCGISWPVCSRLRCGGLVGRQPGLGQGRRRTPRTITAMNASNSRGRHRPQLDARRGRSSAVERRAPCWWPCRRNPAGSPGPRRSRRRGATPTPTIAAPPLAGQLEQRRAAARPTGRGRRAARRTPPAPRPPARPRRDRPAAPSASTTSRTASGRRSRRTIASTWPRASSGSRKRLVARRRLTWSTTSAVRSDTWSAGTSRSSSTQRC